MSKCWKCQNDFTPLFKNNGLPYKTCDICRCTSNKYKDTHKEYTKEYGIYYRELNKDMIKEKAKQYFENNKEKIYAKNKMDRITCECGCTSSMVFFGGFFGDRLNFHTFNCRHRADSRVEGGV